MRPYSLNLRWEWKRRRAHAFYKMDIPAWASAAQQAYSYGKRAREYYDDYTGSRKKARTGGTRSSRGNVSTAPVGRSTVRRMIKESQKKVDATKYFDVDTSLVDAKTALLTTVLPASIWTEGTGRDQMIGEEVAIWRVQCRFRIKGHLHATDTRSLLFRIIIAWAREPTLVSGDFPGTIDGFMKMESVKEHGIHVIHDRQYIVGPQDAVSIAIANTYSKTTAAVPAQAFWNTDLKLGGRNMVLNDAHDTVLKGQLYTWVFSETATDVGLRFSAKYRVWFSG